MSQLSNGHYAKEIILHLLVIHLLLKTLMRNVV